MRCTFLLCLSAILGLSSAFVAPSSRIAQSASRADTSLAPQFDPSTEKWEPSSDADLEGSYSAVGTLVRAGPKPFLVRLVNPGEYDQAVYKYMANENVGRKEAMGNMDAYFENAQDWAYQKNVERNGGYKKDYTSDPSPKQLSEFMKCSKWCDIICVAWISYRWAAWLRRAFLNTYMLLSLDLFLHTLSFAALVAIWSGIVVWFANDLISGVSAGNYY